MSTIVIPPAPASNGVRLEEKLRAAGWQVRLTPPGGGRVPWTEQQVQELFADADVIVATPGRLYPKELLRAAKRLRLITSAVIGVDNIDVDAATELGIMVANVLAPENIIGVAESTIMLIVALLLNLKLKERTLRGGQFRPNHVSHMLHGKTVGLVGYGRIGRAVEARLQGWGVTVQASDPYVPGTLALDDLLRTSDVISLHVVLTAETRNMIGARQLALMKPSAIIVNTSRGGAVVEADLAAAINAGAIAGAAVDTFEQEPINMDNPLLACDSDRVILTPHSIGHNVETGPSGIRIAFENVEHVLRGELPENVINREVIPAWRERLPQLN